MNIKNLSKYLLIAVIAIAAIFGLTSASKQNQSLTSSLPQSTQEEIHFHAGFQVYKDNILQDFSDFKYMKIEPCSLESHEEESENEEQLEKAHLHDGVGDVVHVHRDTAIWADLFQNINVSIDQESEGYINGEKVDDILSLPIKKYDRVVIFEGKNSEIQQKLAGAVTNEHIMETEQKSENCGS
jgi:hypothetical protein